jgi:hypothetical protein
MAIEQKPTPQPRPKPVPGAAAQPAPAPAPGKTDPKADTKGPAAAPGENPEEEDLHYVSFWQKPWVQSVLPFATSLLFHAGLVLLAIVTYKAAEQIVQVVKEQIIIPDATIVEGAEVGGIPNPGLGGDPNRPAAQDEYPDVSVTSDGWAEKPSDQLNQTLMGGGSGENEGESVIGIGGNTSIGGRGRGMGSGSGDGTGSGTGDGGGPLAPFGVPGGGGGIGPKSPFMGVSGNARMVAYVCDATGSMMQKFDLLKIEIRRAVDTLRPIQAFNVIFFQEDDALAASKAGLMMANADNKRRTYDFLDEVSMGPQSNPIPGIRLAFQQKPQLIYLLTDGEFPNNDEVIRTLRELNKEKLVKINTIAFANPGEENEEYVKILKQIASEHGGVFRFVTTQDLNR